MHFTVTSRIKRFILYGAVGARRFEIFSRGGLAVCKTHLLEQVSSRRSVCMIYDRSYPKSGYWNFNIRYNRPIPSLSDPLWLLPPSFSSFSNISLRFSTLPKSTSCAHPLSMLLESRTPLIQGLFRERLWSRGSMDADCSTTFSSAKIYSFAKYVARECRC